MRFVKSDDEQATNPTISHIYENPLLKRFIRDFGDRLRIDGPTAGTAGTDIPDEGLSEAMKEFTLALDETTRKHFNAALMHYDQAISAQPESSLENYYKAFYLMNRAVLRADMIEFISSMENNVQTLSMDDSGNTRARVKTSSKASVIAFFICCFLIRCIFSKCFIINTLSMTIWLPVINNIEGF